MWYVVSLCIVQFVYSFILTIAVFKLFVRIEGLKDSLNELITAHNNYVSRCETIFKNISNFLNNQPSNPNFTEDLPRYNYNNIDDDNI